MGRTEKNQITGVRPIEKTWSFYFSSFREGRVEISGVLDSDQKLYMGLLGLSLCIICALGQDSPRRVFQGLAGADWVFQTHVRLPLSLSLSPRLLGLPAYWVLGLTHTPPSKRKKSWGMLQRRATSFGAGCGEQGPDFK